MVKHSPSPLTYWLCTQFRFRPLCPVQTPVDLLLRCWSKITAQHLPHRECSLCLTREPKAARELYRSLHTDTAINSCSQVDMQTGWAILVWFFLWPALSLSAITILCLVHAHQVSQPSLPNSLYRCLDCYLRENQIRILHLPSEKHTTLSTSLSSLSRRKTTLLVSEPDSSTHAYTPHAHERENICLSIWYIQHLSFNLISH